MAKAKLIGEIERQPLTLELEPHEQDILFLILRSVGGPPRVPNPRGVVDEIRKVLALAVGKSENSWSDEVYNLYRIEGSLEIKETSL